MVDEGRKIETKSVQAFRGLESRTITNWEQEGWRLVTQAPGKLRTELTFERERPPLPKKALIGAAAALVVVAVIITIGVISERNDPTAGAAATTAAAPATSAAVPTPSDAPVDPSTPAASESAEAAPLTAASSKDLAALLKTKTNCEDSIGTFANKYQDQAIQFDGAIAAIALHGSNKTRYDILIVPGKAEAVIGPTFQYRNKNTTSDFGWTGANVPDTVGVGTKLRFTATVGEYDADTCLFQLDPLATAAR